MNGRTERTPEKEAEFLNYLAASANVTRSCELSGIARTSAYEWRRGDDDFRARWDKAIETGLDALEDEAVRRGVDGVDEPVFYQGEVCGTVRKYSDTLLMHQLNGRRSAVYRQRHELSGDPDRPLSPVDPAGMEIARRLAFLLSKAAPNDGAA